MLGVVGVWSRERWCDAWRASVGVEVNHAVCPCEHVTLRASAAQVNEDEEEDLGLRGHLEANAVKVTHYMSSFGLFFQVWRVHPSARA